jgi:hypothetical protein
MPSEEDMIDDDVEAMAGRPDEEELGEEEVEMMSTPTDEEPDRVAMRERAEADDVPEDETAVNEDAVPETANAVEKPKRRAARKTPAAPRKTTRKKSAE